MTTHARFDKHGRRLPDTGRGCGCRLCEEKDAPRYERRGGAASEAPGSSSRAVWHPLHRHLARLLVRNLG